MPVLFQWIFAHLLADFALQSRAMVVHKKCFKAKSWQLYLHCLIHSVLIYLFTPDKTLWIVPLIVFVSHFVVDIWKLYKDESVLYFVIDQLIHIVILIILWMLFIQRAGWWHNFSVEILTCSKIWIIASGYTFISYPLSILLGYGTQSWRKEIEGEVSRTQTSLCNAGKWIGIFERILAYTFVISNIFEGIGFLIAAKSVLRLKEISGANARKEAEYILIGTLMSFSASILIGLATNLLIKRISTGTW